MDKTVCFHYHKDDRHKSLNENWFGDRPETEEERIEVFKYIFAHLFYNIFDCFNDRRASAVHSKYFFHDDFLEMMEDLKSKL